MSQVNLLPPEIRQRSKARQQVVAILLAGAAVVALLVVWFLILNVQLSQVNADLAAQEATNSSLTGQVNDLLPYEELQQQLEASEVRVAQATAYEISWASVLRDLQLKMPEQMRLSTFSGTLTATAAAPPAPVGSGPPIVGSLALAGESQGSLRLARWLTRLSEVGGWGNPWMPSASKGDGDRWTFSTSVDLFLPVVTDRGLEIVTNETAAAAAAGASA